MQEEREKFLKQAEERIIFLESYINELKSEMDNAKGVEFFRLGEVLYAKNIELESKKRILGKIMHDIEKVQEQSKEDRYKQLDQAFPQMVKRLRDVKMDIPDTKLKRGILDRFKKGYKTREEKGIDFNTGAGLIDKYAKPIKVNG